jgi:hypothetical protein
VELCQRKTAIRHERFVRGQACLGLVQQLPLQRRFSWLIRVGLYQQAGQG